MTISEKTSMLKSLLDPISAELAMHLDVYLAIAKKEIIGWRYGNSSYPNIAKAKNSNGNDVKVSAVVFIESIKPVSGTSYTFTYSEDDESWKYANGNVDLTDYGLTYEAEPVDAETIIVKYDEKYMAEYDMVQVMACVDGFNTRGVEGQTGHDENDINRTFKYPDMLSYIRSNVVQIAGVV